ncbi:MAG: NYN domain-containing protein [Halobacteriales archaeon]|nr:NYN domain-containing protein [Halobacteriales archaeon]
MGILGRWLGRGQRVALLVDGPNVFRSEFDVDLADLRAVAEERGRVTVARCYFDVNATPGLLQAAEAHGFEVAVTSGDVDVSLAVDATELAAEGAVDVLVIASRDMDFKPALEAANRRGVRTVAVAPSAYGRSEALSAVADEALTLGE